MAEREIEAIRSLLTGKPKPIGWTARRERLEEVGAVWPVAEDVAVEAVNVGGPPGEFSIVPGSDPSRILLFFHGGGYRSGSIVSHRRMVTEAGRFCGARTLAVGYRLAPEHPFPAALDDALAATQFAEAAGAARVALTLEVSPHMIHAWPVWNAGLEAGRRALAHLGAFARRYPLE